MDMNRRKKTLALVSFLAQFTICMVNFALIYHLKFRFALSSSAIGIASSIYTVAYFLSCLALEKPLRRLGRRMKAMSALIGMGGAHLLILLAPSAWMVYPLLAFYGIAMSLLWPNMEAWITSGDDEDELPRSLSLFNFSWSFGAGLSTMVGGFLVEIGSGFAVAFSVMLFLAASLLLLSIGKGREEEAGHREETTVAGTSTDLRFFSWVGIFLSYSCYALMVNIFPLYALEHLGFSEGLTGTLLLARGMTACFSFLLLSRLGFWKFSMKTIMLSQAALALIFIAFRSMRSPVGYAAVFLLYGFVFALVYELSIFHGAYGAENPDRRMVIHEVLINVGQVLGSVLGGILYQKYSFTLILMLLSMITAIALSVELVAYAVLRRRRA